MKSKSLRDDFIKNRKVSKDKVLRSQAILPAQFCNPCVLNLANFAVKSPPILTPKNHPFKLNFKTTQQYLFCNTIISYFYPSKKIKIQSSKNLQMENISIAAQLIVALSIIIVWVFRFDNIVKEFKQYELSDQMRTIVGATKLILATLLIVGIWHKEFVLIPALVMGLLMISAQYFHFKVNNPWQKRMPSLFLLALCLFIATVSLNLIS